MHYIIQLSYCVHNVHIYNIVVNIIQWSVQNITSTNVYIHT